MLWILESTVPLPTAAILLCAGYFTLALFAALLIHGLATVSTEKSLVFLFKYLSHLKKKTLKKFPYSIGFSFFFLLLSLKNLNNL